MGDIGSKIKITFEEKLKFEIKTKDKNREHVFLSDQPVDEGGTDMGPHPVEYLVSSLGACIGTMIAFYAKEKKIALTGFSVEVEYEKEKNPYRVSRIEVKVNYPNEADHKTRKIMERVARTCIVHNTLEHPPQISIKFPWS